MSVRSGSHIAFRTSSSTLFVPLTSSTSKSSSTTFVTEVPRLKVAYMEMSGAMIPSLDSATPDASS
ncbi:hypothetical protein FRC03_009917 [Tulasnella sp. 419]|nr:hypothetical protein FRC03_009917 [Tulasnella sp. 419]